MIKEEFSASLLQSSLSHDPAEIILICWFAAQEFFYIFTCYYYQYLEYFFSGFFDEKKGPKIRFRFKFSSIIHYTIQKLGVSRICIVLGGGGGGEF